MIVYAFQHCDCIYESSFETMSIHATKGGAYRAMNRYLNEQFNYWRDYQCRGIGKSEKNRFKTFIFEAWRVQPIEVKNE